MDLSKFCKNQQYRGFPGDILTLGDLIIEEDLFPYMACISDKNDIFECPYKVRDEAKKCVDFLDTLRNVSQSSPKCTHNKKSLDLDTVDPTKFSYFSS